MRLSLACVLALAATTSGCATTLSSLQTADTTDVGQVQVTGGLGVFANVGPVVSLISQGKDQADAIKAAQSKGETYTLSEEDKQALLTAGLALAMAPPSASYELGVRTGVAQNADVGFRYSANAVRLDGKYRFLHRSNGEEPHAIASRSVDMAVGFGVSKYLFSNPVFDYLDYVKLGDFSRWDFEVPVIVSYDLGDVFRVYTAARYLYSRTRPDAELVNLADQGSEMSGLKLGLPSLVHSHFYGATVGVGGGYRWVHLNLELTGGYTYCRTAVFGQRRDLGGATFYPAVGLELRFN